MTTFAETLKKEIARIARKELREEITALRKIAMSQRTDISALKKEVKSLQSSLKKLEKLRASPMDRPARGAANRTSRAGRWA